MKHLVLGLTVAGLALAQHPKVSECFKVHEMIRADEEHYWTTWTNACPYTIDSVYVMVKFADRAAHEVADGVWSLHFIPPGAHRTMRFSAPGKLSDFAYVHQRRITSDIYEAFGRVAPLSPVETAAVSALAGSPSPRVAPVAAIVTDSGEGAYREERTLEILEDILASTAVAQAIPAMPPAAMVSDPGEGSFRTDFPDPWRAVLTPHESAVSQAPQASFVRFVSEEKPIFQ